MARCSRRGKGGVADTKVGKGALKKEGSDGQGTERVGFKMTVLSGWTELWEVVIPVIV